MHVAEGIDSLVKLIVLLSALLMVLLDELFKALVVLLERPREERLEHI